MVVDELQAAVALAMVVPALAVADDVAVGATLGARDLLGGEARVALDLLLDLAVQLQLLFQLVLG